MKNGGKTRGRNNYEKDETGRSMKNSEGMGSGPVSNGNFQLIPFLSPSFSAISFKWNFRKKGKGTKERKMETEWKKANFQNLWWKNEKEIAKE